MLFGLMLTLSAEFSYNEWKDPGASYPPSSDSTFTEHQCSVANDCSGVAGRLVGFVYASLYLYV